MSTKTIIINKLNKPAGLTNPIIASIYYKPYYAANYILLASGVPVDASGYMSPGIPVTLTIGSDYMLMAKNELGECTYSQWIRLTECNCDPGYTLSDDGSYCYKVDVQPATEVLSSPPLTVCHYTLMANYGAFGSVFYKYGKFNVDGTWNIADATAYPTILTNNPSAGYNVAHFNTTAIVAPNVWIETNAGTTVSRLNQGGLWDCASQTAIGERGFGRQYNLPASQIYYIGLGADNVGKLTVNGEVILQQSVAATGTAAYFNEGAGFHMFRYWHVFPVMMNAGPNNIQLSVNNLSSNGIMGFEIYAATESQLTACVTDADLNPYIVFSTKNVTDGTLSDLGSYNCDAFPGYTLVNQDGVYTCQFIFKADPIC